MKHTNWSFFSFSQTHPGKVRTYNEDAYLALQKEGVWVVADGMGGHESGDIASRILVDTVEQTVTRLGKEYINPDRIREALLDANERIFQYGRHDLSESTIGTTAIVLLIENGNFHCLWVGDSRFYLYRDKVLIQKSKDHSQVMEMVEQGLIGAKDAEDHPMANVITRAVGVDRHLMIDQLSGSILPNDQFLLCSDGLSKELTLQDMNACFQAQSVNDVGLALMHSALVRGASDNVTCVVVKASQQHLIAAQTSHQYLDATVPVFTHQRAIRGSE